MGQRQKYSPNLKHVRHLQLRRVHAYGDEDINDVLLWIGANNTQDCYFTENVLDRLVSCS